MLGYALELQHRFDNSVSRKRGKQKGQVFTPPEIARFMAGLFGAIPNEYVLLDAGAGVGILTTAFCERIRELRNSRTIFAHAFENDAEVVPLLRRNLENCRRVLSEAGHVFDYAIHAEDFVLAAYPALSGQRRFDEEGFSARCNGVIMNPPYFKLRRDSVHAKRMERVVHGQPNIYAFFMALAARLLKQDGEIVAITPRSFCNGLYFRDFRRWYFDKVGLDHIHIFESRTDAFKHSDVLQESVITKVHRLGKQAPSIAITTSFGAELADRSQRIDVPSSDVFDDSSGDCIVRIPGDEDDREIIRSVESLPCRFSDTGLRISTGPVVLFRATEFLLADSTDRAAVPLLHPHNIKPFATLWPLPKNGKPKAFRRCDGSTRLLVPVKNYVLVKRFSAKEEKRRLTAGCLLRKNFAHSHIGIENHVNYIYHPSRDLSEDEVYGIAAVFNSALIDRYFRTISGNTQVNATEIRSMPFPDLEQLGRIGKRIRRDVGHAESIVQQELFTANSRARCLIET